MGEAGNAPFYDLDKCLERRNLPGAWFAATQQGVTHLDQFLLITILLGEEGSKAKYEAAARKFMVRFIREIKPTIEQMKIVSEALYVIGDEDSFPPERGQAGKAMTDLAGQIRERLRPKRRNGPPAAKTGRP